MDRRRLTVLLLFIPLGAMTALVVESVPLYRLFCRATGYAGTPRVATAGSRTVGGPVTVRFDANVMPNMPWRFAPERNSLRVRTGETALVFFRVTNMSEKAMSGTTVFNVAPAKAATYVNKIQCFCFTTQRLDGGETKEMPVTFFIDPKIATDPETSEVRTITFSYTFYRTHDQTAGGAAAGGKRS